MNNTIYWDKLRVLVTNSCNYRCPFCHNEGQDKVAKGYFMDLDMFKTLIDFIKDSGLSEITFSGGEPFLNDKIVDMLEYTAENTNCEISCATNLSLITKEQINRLSHIPLKFNIQFPFADDIKFRKSTCNGNISHILSNIRIVQNAGIGIGLNCVVQSKTPNDVRNIVLFAIKEELPLKLLPQIGLIGSAEFKNFVFPILEDYAINVRDKHTGAIRWIVESEGHKTSVLYIDSPCFSHDIRTCRNYSEIRLLPDFYIQPCLLRQEEKIKLDLSQGADFIKQQFRDTWNNLKHC